MVIIGSVMEPTPPYMIVWELTNHCNLGCNYCYVGKGNSSYQSFETCLSTLEILEGFGVKRIVFSGGEPLLHPQIMQIIYHAMDQSFETVLVTNGTLIHDDVAKELKEAGISFVQVSLDGDELTHNEIRGKGCFCKTVNGIKCLTKARIDVVVRFTATRTNIMSLPSLIKICKVLGVALDAGLVKPTGKGRISDLPATQTYFEVVDRLLNHIGDNLVQSSRSCHPIESYAYEQDHGPRRCLAGTDLAAITHNGKFIPCPYISGQKSLKTSGLVFDFPDFGEDIENLWASSKLFSLFRLSKCLDCPLSALILSGDFNGADPYGVSSYHKLKRKACKRPGSRNS